MESVEPTNEESVGSREVFARLKEIARRLVARDSWELVQVSHQKTIWEKYEKQIAVHMAPDYDNFEIEMKGWKFTINNSSDVKNRFIFLINSLSFEKFDRVDHIANVIYKVSDESFENLTNFLGFI